jgi:uncharacterized membrane protein
MTIHAPSSNDSDSRPFRSAVFSGLAVLMPPLLTVVIFLWIGGTVQDYFLRPLIAGARGVLVWSVADVWTESQLPGDQRGQANPTIGGTVYQKLPDGNYVPRSVYLFVKENPGEELPDTAQDVYRRYVELTYMRPYLSIPLLLSLFLLLLYLLGNFMAVRIGRGLLGIVESAIQRVPLVRNVYTAVKKISDFLLSQRELEYSRVVAVEYPRKGMWQLGLVTGDGIPDLEAEVGEPMLSVLIPCSPMPMTGFTVNVLKRETVDLNMTIDQAIQYLVSCGVVVPPRQLREMAVPGTVLPAAEDVQEKNAGV